MEAKHTDRFDRYYFVYLVVVDCLFGFAILVHLWHNYTWGFDRMPHSALNPTPDIHPDQYRAWMQARRTSKGSTGFGYNRLLLLVLHTTPPHNDGHTGMTGRRPGDDTQ